MGGVQVGRIFPESLRWVRGWGSLVRKAGLKQPEEERSSSVLGRDPPRAKMRAHRGQGGRHLVDW